MLVQQILKAKSDDGVVTVPPGSSIAAAAEVLSSRRIGAVVVSRDGKRPDGMLSERDIVRELGRRGAGCLSDKVEAIMTSKIVTCACTDEADRIMQVMTEGRFRHLPVMAEGEMVGLISIGDVVKARLSELSMEKDALEGMIKGF
ncbi:CBS domain-containing protein [Cereibacter sphaeroides]|uniref:CBS domain-containing protein n=1 Tax=Cereibacter sphaeroides TaxID=1063 RepID=UPI000191C642|nr:CBS domain-containing protein [Cereibacter sphaeroides]ACM01143.1 CBS domain containing protein [Cereibacter sphaeroides KD131]EKX56527.1 Inosine-5'-monophosphate dehydrogenase [Rhodobacter sp. AKP1]RHZ94829.1 CBS domain-containing protein [Cereibacter sphaeroides]